MTTKSILSLVSVLLLASGSGVLAEDSRCLVVSDLAWRQVDKNTVAVTYSLKVNVRNSCGRDAAFALKFQALDAKGFEVDHALIEGSVPAGATKSITGTTMVKNEVAAQIVKWQFVEAYLY